MSQGQGSISYQSPPAAGGGGAGPNPNGARDGVTIEDGYVVLGNLDTDLTDPAELIDNRRIQMQAFVLYFSFDDDQAWNWTLNSQSAGGASNTIPTAWISPDSSYWAVYQPGNYLTDYTPYGSGNRWTQGYSIYPGVNEPMTSRPNVVGMFWGYNTTYQQGQLVAGEAAFRWATETFYIIGTDPNFEFHTPEITTDAGVIYRLDSTYVSRATGVGFREYIMPNQTWYTPDYLPATGLAYALLSYNPAADETEMVLFSQLAGGVAILYLGNHTDGSGFIDWQSGEMEIFSPAIVQATSVRTILNPSSHSNLVNPSVFSNNDMDTPNGDAMVDIQSVLLGFRPPSMSTAQKNALTPVGPGLVVFDNVLGKLCLFGNASTWETVTSV